MWAILIPKNVLHSNLTGSPGFFLLSESGDLSKGRHGEPGTGGSEDPCAWYILLTVLLLIVLYMSFAKKNRVSARQGAPKLSLELLTWGISLHFSPAPAAGLDGQGGPL